MTTIIEKLRNLIEDGYKFNSEIQEYLGGAKIFTLEYANIDATSLVVKKNGTIWSMTPVAGSGVAWTRTSTVVTITKATHGLITGDVITISVSSDATALPLGAKVITKLTADTFTVVGLNAGATSGTCTYTITDNYSYSSSTGKVTITGTLTSGENVTFEYNAFEKYSDAELRGWIRSALVYMSTEKYKTFTAKSDNIIFPTPSETEENLIALISQILINGSIRSYKTPEITIVFNENESKDEKIRRAIDQFKKSYGYMDYIDTGNRSAELEDN